MNEIIITGDDIIAIDGKEHKIVGGGEFKPGYTDFAPRLREERDEETQGLIVEFGIHRLVRLEGETKRVKSEVCHQYIVLPNE